MNWKRGCQKCSHNKRICKTFVASLENLQSWKFCISLLLLKQSILINKSLGEKNTHVANSSQLLFKKNTKNTRILPISAIILQIVALNKLFEKYRRLKWNHNFVFYTHALCEKPTWKPFIYNLFGIFWILFWNSEVNLLFI